jgi:thioredoxin reductase (NADPH)
MQLDIKDIVIIGAGPAGVSAAVQLKRLGTPVCLVDKKGIAGGLVENAYCIENYSGLEEPVKGSEFANRIRKNLSSFDLEITKFDVKKITTVGPYKKISDDKGNSILAKEIIIAVGTVPNKYVSSTIPEDRLFYDLTSLKNSQLFKDVETISIIGGGESALDYALSLSELGKNVILYVRSNKLKAAKRLIDLVEKNKQINIRYNSIVEDGDLFLAAIGRRTALDNINVALGIVEEELIVGDARLGGLGQLGIAVGDGLIAAKKIYMRLKSENTVL